jgi:hypothetical protein
MFTFNKLSLGVTNKRRSPLVRLRHFLGFDPVLNSYGELATAWTPTGNFEAGLNFSTTSSAAQTLFGGELAGTDEIKLEINTSGFVVASAYVGTSLQTAITSTVALDNGKFHSAKIVYTGTTAELFVNDVSIGTQTWALNGSQTIKYVGRLSTGAYFNGVPANPVLTDVTTPANSLPFRLNKATGNYELPVNNVMGSELYSFADVGSSHASVTITQIGSGYSVTTSVDGHDRTYINFPTEVGATYRVAGSQIANTSGNNVTWFVRNGVNGTGSIYASTTETNPDLVFKATGTNSTILMDVGTSSAPLTYRYDDISIKKVTNALIYNNIPEASRFQAQLVGRDWVGTTERNINGNFVTSSDWTLSANATISGGLLNFGSGTVTATQEILTLGAVYKLEYDVDTFVGAEVGASSASFTSALYASGTGITEGVRTASSANFTLVSTTDGNKISSSSAKRILEAP